MNNILFVIADALRADHLGTYGYHLNTSPFIDSLASESFVAERCYSQGNTTEQEMSTMLTGRYPEEHGVLGQDHPDDIPDDMPTWLEILQDNGYTTFTISFTSKALERGSDEFIRTTDTSTIKQLVNKKSNELEEPWAMIVHLMDCHVPYKAHSNYFKQFYNGDPLDSSIAIDPEELMGPTPRPEGMEKEIKQGVDPQYFSAKYDAAIRGVDEVISDIYYSIVEEEDVDLIFTADHGESLTEHNILYSHRGLYEPTIRVPFIYNSDNISPERYSYIVEHVDYFPSILDVLGIEHPNISGNSAFNSTHKIGAHFCENTWNSARGTIHNEMKLITYHGTKLHTDQSIELYDLKNDPEELNNLAQRDAETCIELQNIQGRFIDSLDIEKDPLIEQSTTLPDNHPSDEVKERLEDLGYI